MFFKRDLALHVVSPALTRIMQRRSATCQHTCNKNQRRVDTVLA
jgi:hypothetical protein